jgi:hypothetical protein
VADLTDEESFMQLVLSNAQSELDPLEIGCHALNAIELGIGGKGKKGGLSEYARQVGKSQQYLTQVRQAAEVLQTIELTTQVVGLFGKAKHLSVIHAAPCSLWPLSRPGRGERLSPLHIPSY